MASDITFQFAGQTFHGYEGYCLLSSCICRRHVSALATLLKSAVAWESFQDADPNGFTEQTLGFSPMSYECRDALRQMIRNTSYAV